MQTYEKDHSGTGLLQWIYAKDLTYHPHLHFSFEIVFCLEGEITVTINAKTYTLTVNQGAIIPYNTVHSYHTPQNSQIYSLLAGQGLLRDITKHFQQQLPVRYTFCVDPMLRQMILEHFYSGRKQTVFGAKAIIYQAFDAFMEHNTFAPRNFSDHSITVRLPEYIQEHFRENITLEDFAKYSDYNYFYVSKLIKRSFGLSFSQLLTEYRIAYAQELLQEKELNISQIALQCGFGSIRNFNRTFLKSVGKTPREFRINGQ